MKRIFASAAAVLLFGGGSAWAGCVYDGITYEVGTVICAEGWLQECTVANYWSAIGQCGVSDVTRSSSILPLTSAPRLGSLPHGEIGALLEFVSDGTTNSAAR